MKKLARASVAAIGILGVIAMFASFLLGIWTEDDRWVLTGLTALFVAFIGIAGAAYPGWDD